MSVTKKFISNPLVRQDPIFQQRKIAFGNSLGFKAQIEDLRLKCCILEENPKNKSSGRKIAWGPPKILPTGGLGSRFS
jgi:hypothetical protein